MRYPTRLRPSVVVQAVGIEGCLAVFEHHLPSGHGHLVVAVIIGILAKEREGVALIHLYITKGLEGVRGLIKVCAVAKQFCSIMPKLYVAVKNLRVGILELVVRQYVGMHKIDPIVIGLLYMSSTLFFLWRRHSERNAHNKSHRQKQNLPLSHVKLQRLAYPAVVFKLTVAIARVDAHVGSLNLVNHPLVQFLVTPLILNNSLHDLEIFGYFGLVSINAVL